MTPGFKFLGIVFIAVLLAVAMVNGAHAGEPDAECMAVMGPEAAKVHLRHTSGVPSDVNRHLIRSDPHYAGQGRWVLLRFLDALETGTAVAPVDILGALCAIPNIPAAAPVYRNEFNPPRDI